MNKNKKITLFCMLILFFIMIFSGKVNAASASISASSTTVNVGDEVTVTITINGAAWNIHVSGAVTADYAGNTPDAENTTKVEKKKFKASAVGTYKVSLQGDVTGSEDTSAKKVSDNLTITVKEKGNNATNNNTTTNNTTNNNKDNKTNITETTKSNNANLSNLGIKPNDFKGFKASKTSYDVTVPNDVEKITVYATAQDNKAKIKGNESQKLKVGKNTLNVVVTAEDGTQKTYTINVTREEANQTEENTSNTTTNETSSEKTQETQSETNSDLKNLSIKGYTLNPAFSPNVYEYKVDVNGDVSSLDIETEGSSHNVSVDIVGNENLTEGENTITVLVYNEETKQNSTYQIIVNKTNLDMTDINKTMNDAAKKAQKVRYIIFGILAFIVVCIIAFVIVKKRLKNKDEDDNDEDVELPKAIRNNDENDENDEEELQHNKTRKKGRHF